MYFEAFHKGQLRTKAFHHHTIEKDHGRIEERDYWAVPLPDGLRSEGWTELTSIAMVRSQRTLLNETSIEDRYFICSVNTQNYQEMAFFGVPPRTSPAFANQTSTQFAYNVGAGIDLLLSPQFILSFGYDYQSVGNIVSGPGQNKWSETPLNLGRYGLNTALLSVTYLFDNPFVARNQK